MSGAEIATICAPFWGFSPNSNRWADVEYPPWGDGDRQALFDGDDVRSAINNGWLLAERHDTPGFIMDDPEEGGKIELVWRYHSVPAWRTIVLHRQRLKGLLQ